MCRRHVGGASFVSLRGYYPARELRATTSSGASIPNGGTLPLVQETLFEMKLQLQNSTKHAPAESRKSGRSKSLSDSRGALGRRAARLCSSPSSSVPLLMLVFDCVSLCRRTVALALSAECAMRQREAGAAYV